MMWLWLFLIKIYLSCFKLKPKALQEKNYQCICYYQVMVYFHYCGEFRKKMNFKLAYKKIGNCIFNIYFTGV